jgi:hypothetical protein
MKMVIPNIAKLHVGNIPEALTSNEAIALHCPCIDGGHQLSRKSFAIRRGLDAVG